MISVAAPKVIKMQTSWPSSDIWMDFARQYTERVERMSGGRLKVDLLPAGAVVGAFQVMDAVSDGVLDAAHTVPVYWYGKHKAASLFGTGPVFGGSATTMIAWFHVGGGKELYAELTQEIMGLNVYGFYGFPMPAEPFGWFKKPVTKVAELKGFKYRTVGLAADLMQKMGMSVAQLPGGEIVPAMERGVIEGAEWINCLEDKKLGLHKTAKYYYTPGMHEPVTGGQLMINKEVWAKLTPDLQEMIKVASVYATTMRNQMFNRETADACLELIQEGVQMRRMPDDVLVNFLNEWEKIQGEYAAKNPFYKKVIDSQKAYASKVVPFRLSWFPPYDFAGNYYWKDKVYLKK
jgi:TRAP-type mannitol/chloroaromatic compound transport system substrate-binding protein